MEESNNGFFGLVAIAWFFIMFLHSCSIDNTASRIAADVHAIRQHIEQQGQHHDTTD